MGKDFRHADPPGLYCVEIRTQNWRESVEWYRRALGLRVLVRVVDDGYALLEAGDTRLALLARDTAGEPSVRFSFAFEVTDLQAALTRLQEHGVEVSVSQTQAEGMREANLSDPDGNRIRLFSWPKER